MSYTPQTWHDTPATDTPISAARLGVMEAGIAAAASTVNPHLDITAVTPPAAPSSGVRLYNRTGTSGLDALAWVNNLGVPIVIGRDIGVFCKNISGSTIAKGSAVYVASATTSVVNIAKAQADSGMSKLPCVGITATDITNNTFGLVIQFGVIQNLNTAGFGDGVPVFVDPTTAGALTATRPTHPNPAQMIGVVINSNTTTGSILACVTQYTPSRDQGVNGSSFAIGDGTGSGAKSVLFKNSNTGTLQWTPTANRTLTLPDVTDSLVGKTHVDTQNCIRPGGYVSGQYYMCSSANNAQTSAGLGIGNLRLAPWIVPATVRVGRLWAEFTVAGDAGSVFRIGVYNDDGTGKPGTLLVDGGTVAMTGTPANVETTVDFTLTPGLYWVGGALQGGTVQATVRTVQPACYDIQLPLGTTLAGIAAGVAPFGWIQGSVPGALPSTLASPVITSPAPRIGFRVY